MIARTPSLRELRANRPENVVILPTASPRQVQQNCNKASRAAKHQLKYLHAERFPYCDPGVRAKMPDAAALLLVERSPELLLSIAMFEALTEDQRNKVRAQCEMLKFTGPSARAAAALIQVRTIGDSVDLNAAMALLREERP